MSQQKRLFFEQGISKASVLPNAFAMEDRQAEARLALGRAGPLRFATADAHARRSPLTHPTTDDWNHHRERIVDLYIKQRKTLKDVAQTMLNEHGLYAT
jgi:uncharacterized protein YbjT (DUF2867 family)